MQKLPATQSDAPLDVGTLQEAVCETLRHAITRGILPPGTRLVEEALATDLGVSRSPVREAIRRLSGPLGLVSFTPQRGATVLSFAKQELADICDARVELEMAAIRTYFASGSDGERVLADLDSLNAQMDAAVGRDGYDGLVGRQLNAQFHKTLVSLTPNHCLTRLFAQVSDRMWFAWNHTAIDIERHQIKTNEHKALVAAIRCGNMDSALALIEKHAGSLSSQLRHEAVSQIDMRNLGELFSFIKGQGTVEKQPSTIRR